jgi:hypothetical protein
MQALARQQSLLLHAFQQQGQHNQWLQQQLQQQQQQQWGAPVMSPHPVLVYDEWGNPHWAPPPGHIGPPPWPAPGQPRGPTRHGAGHRTAPQPAAPIVVAPVVPPVVPPAVQQHTPDFSMRAPPPAVPEAAVVVEGAANLASSAQ